MNQIKTTNQWQNDVCFELFNRGFLSFFLRCFSMCFLSVSKFEVSFFPHLALASWLTNMTNAEAVLHMQIVQCCVALVLTSCYSTIGTNHKACHLFLVENLFWQYRCNHELDKRRLLWVVLSRLFDVPFCVVFLCVFGYVPTCNAVAACNSIACEGLVVVLSRLCVVPFANCNAVAACNSMTKRRLLWLVFVPFCVVFGYVSSCNAVATRNLLASWA